METKANIVKNDFSFVKPKNFIIECFAYLLNSITNFFIYAIAVIFTTKFYIVASHFVKLFYATFLIILHIDITNIFCF